jgi:hypothetical protein
MLKLKGGLGVLRLYEDEPRENAVSFGLLETRSHHVAPSSLWDSIVDRYRLHATPYEQIANWSFVDWMLNFGEETILSTIKIRNAGFADCIDTHESFRRQLTKLRELRVIP